MSGALAAWLPESVVSLRLEAGAVCCERAPHQSGGSARDSTDSAATAADADAHTHAHALALSADGGGGGGGGSDGTAKADGALAVGPPCGALAHLQTIRALCARPRASVGGAYVSSACSLRQLCLDHCLLSHSDLLPLVSLLADCARGAAERGALAPVCAPPLVTLSLRGNRLGDDGARALLFALAAAYGGTDEQRAHEGARAGGATAAGVGCRVRELDLALNSLSASALDGVCAAIAAPYSTLRAIDLRGNRLHVHAHTQAGGGVGASLGALSRSLLGGATRLSLSLIHI